MFDLTVPELGLESVAELSQGATSTADAYSCPAAGSLWYKDRFYRREEDCTREGLVVHGIQMNIQLAICTQCVVVCARTCENR